MRVISVPGLHRAAVLVVAWGAWTGVAAEPAGGQTFEGRVLDEADDRPVPTALVRLLDEAGEERSITVADSSGTYRLIAPEPGAYRLVAERIGYEPFETPLLDAADAAGSYPVDLLMRRAPIPIAGVRVTAEQADREIRLTIGMNPDALRVAPIRLEEIQEHARRGRDLTGLIRWNATVPVIVRRTTEGPCFQARGRGCLPVYLNGFVMNSETTDLIPLDMLYTIVVVMPSETIAYPGGAVLLFTEAWLR